MNDLLATKEKIEPTRSDKLLDVIRHARAEIGDGLNDHEFTRLLAHRKLPAEAGFTFLGYYDRYVTFGVPLQKTAEWYSERGWISADKEKIAATIAKNCGLNLCRPPDTTHACSELPNPHHHIEMSNQNETIIFIHPQFLKIRLFVTVGSSHSSHLAQRPFQLCPDLLEDLAALYPA